MRPASEAERGVDGWCVCGPTVCMMSRRLEIVSSHSWTAAAGSLDRAQTPVRRKVRAGSILRFAMHLCRKGSKLCMLTPATAQCKAMARLSDAPTTGGDGRRRELPN